MVKKYGKKLRKPNEKESKCGDLDNRKKQKQKK